APVPRGRLRASRRRRTDAHNRCSRATSRSDSATTPSGTARRAAGDPRQACPVRPWANAAGQKRARSVSEGDSSPGFGHSRAMLVDAGIDEAEVGSGPFDGGVEPFLQRHGGGEAERLPSLQRASEALAGAVPGALGEEFERRRVSSQLVYPGRQLEDGGLYAAREVVDVAGPAHLGAGQEATHDVIHVDEV